MSAVQHMVLLKFKEEIGDDKIVEIFNQLEELTRLIGGISYFAGGPYSMERAATRSRAISISSSFMPAVR